MILDVFKSKSEPNLPFPRCQHRSPAGRQCSQPICSTSPHFCFAHKPKPEELTIAELTAAAGSLSTPEEIHRFLTCVTLLRIQDRLTPKEACSYAYLCQILQRGQREIAFHQKLKDDRAERAAEQAREEDALSWSIPRPKMDDDPACSKEPGADSVSSFNTSSSLATDTLVKLSPPVPPVSDVEGIPPARTYFGDFPVTLPSPPVATGASVAVAPSAPAASSSDIPCASVTTRSTVEVFPPPSPVSAKSPTTPSGEKLKRAKPSKSSESSTSSASLTSPTSLSMPPEFYNHFYPFDPSLPPGLQDPRKNIPPPDAAECRARERRRGILPPRLYRKAAARFFGLLR